MQPDLSSPISRLGFVTPIAMKYGLQPSLVAAVCEQESGWDSLAFRPEPAFYERYILPMKLSDPFEAHLRAASFGLMQIMGQTAREFGFDGKFLTRLFDPSLAVIFGCKKLQHCYDVHKTNDTSLLAYNGGGNLLYADQVLARLGTYNLGG